jgi:hypothetical protein
MCGSRSVIVHRHDFHLLLSAFVQKRARALSLLERYGIYSKVMQITALLFRPLYLYYHYSWKLNFRWQLLVIILAKLPSVIVLCEGFDRHSSTN